MDEDTAFAIVIGTLLVLMISSPLLITGCIAGVATRKWAVERHRASYGLPTKADPEGDRLMNPTDENDSDTETDDFLDSEDEEYYNLKRQRRTQEREEREADLRLTPRAKFFKEWRKCWSGPGGTEEMRRKEREFKEQEQHRKIAREAVREYLRIERRKARKVARVDTGKKE